MPKFKKLNKIAYIITAVAFLVTAVNFNFSYVNANSVMVTIYALGKKYQISAVETSLYNGVRYLNNAENTVEDIYYDSYIPYKNAEIVFNENSHKKFTIFSGNNGKAIDKNALLNDINYALNNNEKIINAKCVTVNKKISEDYLLSCTNLRSRFTTYYNGGNERAENIKLACSYLSGSVIDVGEEFSFNGVVGERSEERGFLKAKVILDGEFIDGVGGGVCQVSTTSYNAFLLSGLKIVERHQHSLAVNYIEPSFDAMVSYGLSDLKFTNDTGGLVFIGASVTVNSVTISVYGKKLDKTYERVSVIKEEISPPSALEVESSELYVGESEIIQNAKNGIKSEGYLISYNLKGERIKTTLTSKDSYKSTRQKILIGNKQKEDL